VSIVLFVSSSRASSLSIVCSIHHVFKLHAMYIVCSLVGVILCRVLHVGISCNVIIHSICSISTKYQE
jgi:hypothetical protein